MEFGKSISQIRAGAKLTQAKFAELFGVSAQAVQKWENGTAVPDIEKIVRIAKHFDLSLDALVMGNDNRIVEEQNKREFLKPQYQNLHDWEFYAQRLGDEYEQSTDEGLDIEEYKDVFLSVSRLHKSEIKKKLGDVLFDVIISARQKALETASLAAALAVSKEGAAPSIPTHDELSAAKNTLFPISKR